ncbi:hypothetical protein D3C71_2201680 [compost metagenome]
MWVTLLVNVSVAGALVYLLEGCTVVSPNNGLVGLCNGVAQLLKAQSAIVVIGSISLYTRVLAEVGS